MDQVADRPIGMVAHHPAQPPRNHPTFRRAQPSATIGQRPATMAQPSRNHQSRTRAQPRNRLPIGSRCGCSSQIKWGVVSKSIWRKK
jgi:hypothetical protein